MFDLKNNQIHLLFLHSHITKWLCVLSILLEKVLMDLQLFRQQQTLCSEGQLCFPVCKNLVVVCSSFLFMGFSGKKSSRRCLKLLPSCGRAVTVSKKALFVKKILAEISN